MHFKRQSIREVCPMQKKDLMMFSTLRMFLSSRTAQSKQAAKSSAKISSQKKVSLVDFFKKNERDPYIALEQLLIDPEIKEQFIKEPYEVLTLANNKGENTIRILLLSLVYDSPSVSLKASLPHKGRFNALVGWMISFGYTNLLRGLFSLSGIQELVTVEIFIMAVSFSRHAIVEELFENASLMTSLSEPGSIKYWYEIFERASNRNEELIYSLLDKFIKNFKMTIRVDDNEEWELSANNPHLKGLMRWIVENNHPRILAVFLTFPQMHRFVSVKNLKRAISRGSQHIVTQLLQTKTLAIALSKGSLEEWCDIFTLANDQDAQIIEELLNVMIGFLIKVENPTIYCQQSKSSTNHQLKLFMDWIIRNNCAHVLREFLTFPGISTLVTIENFVDAFQYQDYALLEQLAQIYPLMVQVLVKRVKNQTLEKSLENLSLNNEAKEEVYELLNQLRAINRLKTNNSHAQCRDPFLVGLLADSQRNELINRLLQFSCFLDELFKIPSQEACEILIQVKEVNKDKFFELLKDIINDISLETLKEDEEIFTETSTSLVSSYQKERMLLGFRGKEKNSSHPLCEKTKSTMRKRSS